jgi:hypothetical protein
MSKKIILTTGALLLLLCMNAQELLTPLTFMGPAVDGRARQSSPVAVLDTITLPANGFRDNFMYDNHRPDTILWDLGLQPGVYVNRGWATAPINLGVCTFDGLDWNGLPYTPLASVNSSTVCDVLTSKFFDLTNYDPSDSLILSFWWEAQGKGYAPNQVDSLQLQVNIPAWNTSGEVWKTVWFHEGYNPQGSDTSFHVAMFKLDSSYYFADGFRFRFRNYASGCGSNDHWHIDEVQFKPFRAMSDTFINDVFFVYNPPSMLNDYHQMPGSHYTAASMATNIQMYVRNNDTILRNITYSYEIFQPGIPAPLYSYTGGPDPGLPPFSVGGYSSYTAHANPPVAYQYTPFSAPDTGFYYVNHMLKKGTLPTSPIDTVTYYQRMYNQYAYDDGTAEVGYGIFGSGASLAYRFDMPVGVTDTLKAIQMYFLPVLDMSNLQLREFRLTVWNHSTASNGPGTIVYQQRHENPQYSSVCPNRFSTYTIDSGIVVVSGTFYVGWVQEATDRLYLGMDLENDQKDKIYYNTSGIWYTSVFSGALMMRPVFGDGLYLTGVSETNVPELKVFPNPATDQITIAGLDETKRYDAMVVDISGRTVSDQSITAASNTVDVSSLAPGVYVLSVTDEYGIRSGTQRIVIQ